MAQRTQSAAAERVKQLRERIDHWRSTRVKLRPMSAELWDEATILARGLGVYPVQRALKLNYESLRRRVEAPVPRQYSSDAGWQPTASVGHAALTS